MLPLRTLLATHSSSRAPGRMLLAAVATAALPVAAQALQPAQGDTPVLEVQTELMAPQGSSGVASNLAPGQAAPAGVTQRRMLWARRGITAVGLGVQAPQAPGSSTYSALASAASPAERTSLAPAQMLVGMAVETSARSRLVVDAPVLPAPRLDDSLNPGANSREVRVGLQIKPADPLKSLRAGQLFKLELSTRSQLALKPRSGGMMMSYSAKF